MRQMYDSENASAIPADATLVAGYIDGPKSQWSEADWQRFPNATFVRIAVFASTLDGHVLDVEPQNATAAESPAWTKARLDAGLPMPVVYAGNWATGYTVAEVLAAHDNAGVPRPMIWLGQGDGVPVIPGPGYIGKQYADLAAYDLSVVADYWPGVDPVPEPGPTLIDLQARLDRLNEVLVKRFEGVRAALDPLNPPA